ncbi:minor histocompatibility antigen H13 [Exophiala viscosa]|uniref:Minor histocompatibility antigen H13 n=1 Tax=Exophiala viscosa TaxID=2486360 RepID=A0AAN6IJE9_9EURO|nr:minor histocompatibility antigen H13 [Exophiala viscosa]KAI1626577.1 minor histocompatibility antigen H13 [Exophiala viscosa]
MNVTNVTTGPGPAMEFLGRVAYEAELMQPLIPTYLHLLVSAIFPIWTAAHSSLSRPPSAAPRKRKRKSKQKRGSDDDDDEESDGEDDESQKIESLTPSDAIVFPLLAGATLASLYFILKWLQDPAWLNWVLGIYFSVIGLFFALGFLKDAFSVVRSFALPRHYSAGGKLWEVNSRHSGYRSAGGDAFKKSPLPGLLRMVPLPAGLSKRMWDLRRLLYAKARLNLHVRGLVTVKTSVDVLDVASLVLSCVIVYYHGFVAKPWFLTNFLGFAFCYGSLQYMTPTTAWTGTLVLSALFFYDIYFVFFTPMMVTVATKLDVPIKLLFPRPDGCVLPVGAAEGSAAIEEYLQCLAKKRTMAMLGLGDIVVPGMVLAFALRFDLYLHYLRKTTTEGDEQKKPVYSSAKGSWGERFWTNYKLLPSDVRAKTFPKPYFYATIFGYLAGMITTVIVMQVAAHAQPALLYLVPGVLLSLWGTALLRGDLKALWEYNEMPEEDQKKKDENATKSKIDESEGAASNATLLTGETEQQVEGEKKEAEPEKTVEGGSASKKTAEKGRRRLVYLSITLPEPPSEDATGGNKPSSTSTSSPEQADDSSPKDVNVQQDDSGSLLDEAARRADGEPLEKRARRV